MPTLLVMRHAKSAWDTGHGDHDRPLNNRGYRQAFEAGRYLLGEYLTIDRTLCSTSERTRQTLQRVQDAGADVGEVSFHRDIYESTPADVIPLLRELPDRVETALVVGHYPCVELLVSHLAVPDTNAAWRPLLNKFVTSGIATLSIADSWADLGSGQATLIDFVAPGR